MSPPLMAKGIGNEAPPPPPQSPPPPGVTAAEMATINMPQVLLVGLRVVGFVTTFIATVVMGTAVQRSTYRGYYYDYKAIDIQFIKYFVAANAIATIYSLASLGILIPTMRSPSEKTTALVVAIVDLVIVVFLFSSNGAPIASLAEDESCDSSNHYCSQVTGAIVMSMFGAFDYFILVLLSLLGLNQK